MTTSAAFRALAIYFCLLFGREEQGLNWMLEIELKDHLSQSNKLLFSQNSFHVFKPSTSLIHRFPQVKKSDLRLRNSIISDMQQNIWFLNLLAQDFRNGTIAEWSRCNIMAELHFRGCLYYSRIFEEL